MNEFKKTLEDDLDIRGEWTNCAGDINTATWVSNDGFLCGTTEHSDSHNQQYNKPGNLVLGSCSAGTLRAYPDHRIVRPIVDKGENSTDEMRESQDPWLYTSVVSSDYDQIYDRAFTCGYDRTVKIWKVDKSGGSMELLGTWLHDGNVNFVVASQHPSGMVATAADAHMNAVRVYLVNGDDVSGSRMRSHSCSRVVDDQGRDVSTEKWAYYPATIQWGRCAEVRHLLLVGYSPRSRTQDDNDIPEDRFGTGELCLWDGLTGERWRLLAGSGLNVFEVLWHPTQACFIAATSPQGPVGSELDARIRTQIRIFRRSTTEHHAFSVVQTLDCTAVDINELAIMPNSVFGSYIAAGCTDDKTYMWDTALGDKPIHVLKHGKPMDDFRGQDQTVDPGVKFCAWGNTPDRLYTGSSDGVVKVWNVRHEKPLVRNLLDVKAPVSYGKFSPDKSKLIVGDASGRVYFLSTQEEDQIPDIVSAINIGNLQGGEARRRIPRLVIPHTDPEPPVGYCRHQTGQELARAYLEKGQLEFNIARDPTVGTVQGPNYAETGRYDAAAHIDGDVAGPLTAANDVRQLESQKMWQQKPNRDKRRLELWSAKTGEEPRRKLDELVRRKHYANTSKDLDFHSLPTETQLELANAGLKAVDFDQDYGLDEESQESWVDNWVMQPLARECEGFNCTAAGCAPTCWDRP
jgi:WD40 repeat protein